MGRKPRLERQSLCLERQWARTSSRVTNSRRSDPAGPWARFHRWFWGGAGKSPFGLLLAAPSKPISAAAVESKCSFSGAAAPGPASASLPVAAASPLRAGPVPGWAGEGSCRLGAGRAGSPRSPARGSPGARRLVSFPVVVVRGGTGEPLLERRNQAGASERRTSCPALPCPRLSTARRPRDSRGRACEESPDSEARPDGELCPRPRWPL